MRSKEPLVLYRSLIITILLILPRISTAAPCAIPYSFVNGTVIDAGQMNSNFNAVAACVGSSAANNASNINSGTLAAAYGGTGVSSWTPGGVVYAASTTQLGQDVNNLFWNASSHSLGIGTGNPGFQLDVVGNGHLSGSLFLEQNASVNFKNNVNAYWQALSLDTSNNVSIGSTNFSGQIQFFNNGTLHARLDTSGNFFITGFYGVGSSQIACGNLANAAASCSVNTTNAANITSGTLPTGRLAGAYSMGNLIVSSTAGGGGGNIGLDNGESLQLKDTGGTYRIGIGLDSANNIEIGDVGITGGICLNSNSHACTTFVGANGAYNTNASYIFTHGQLTYNTGTPNYAVFQNPSVTGGAYIALEDNGVVLIQAASGNYSCQMSSSFSPNWGCSSDAELKNWQPLAMVRVVPGAKAADTAIAAILRLRPVSFSWKGDAENHLHMGFLAQDVEQVFPELVGTNPQDGTKLMATDGLIAPLVLAVQELVAEVRGAKNARKR